MTQITRGVPRDLVLAYRERFDATTFVETGTHRANTAIWASDYFRCVHTIEASESLYREAVRRCSSRANVTVHFGDSRGVLRQVVGTLDSPAVFWLDAHWSGGTTHGANDECPLIDELGVLRDREGESLILIDDARLFAAPPPRPHRLEQWPMLSDVFSVLGAGEQRRYVIVLDDVIIASTWRAKELVSHWAQDRATANWETQPAQVPATGCICCRVFRKLRELV